MPAIVASAPVMKVSRDSAGARRPITAAAAGPCSASSAWSGIGSMRQRDGDRRAQVGDVGRLAAGVDDEEQVIGAARHHQVVEDAAGVVGEERVALLALAQADDVDRHQRLERGRGVGADQADLAHVRDVEQRRRLAALAMLGHDAGRIRDRHVVAGERHHLRAELDVQRMQRRLQHRGGGSGVGHRYSSGARFKPAGARAPAGKLPLLSALPERLAAPRTALLAPSVGPLAAGLSPARTLANKRLPVPVA